MREKRKIKQVKGFNQKKTSFRKVRKRRIRARRGVLSFLFTLFAAVLISATVIAAASVFFKITDINCTGQTRYDYSAIISASHIKQGDNMFTLNKFKAINNIKAGFPYLNEVKIRRKLPNVIEISVNEYVPAMYIEDNGEFWVAADNYKLLEKVSDITLVPEGIPKITGIELEQPEVGEIFEIKEKDKKKPLTEILQSVKNDDILNKVNYVDLSHLYQISMMYDSRFYVRLGTADDLERKLRFFHNIEQKLVVTDVGIIDVSDTKTARFIPRDLTDEISSDEQESLSEEQEI